MVWTIFAPDTLIQSAVNFTTSNSPSSRFNHYSTPLTQYREPKSRLDVEKYQLYVEIATDVLQTQNQDQVKALKNFLNTLPSPTDIEAVLTAAVNQLAEIDIETYDWVLKHPDYLLPELDLANVARNLIGSILSKQGFVLKQDFDFTAEGQLTMNPAAEMALFMNCSEVEYLFLQEYLADRA